MAALSSSDTVSQSEIERLLASVGGGDSAAAQTGAPEQPTMVRHEFPRLSLFSSGELRKLRVRHEDFVNALAGRLSLHLGLEVGLQMSQLETVPFQTFTEALASPTHLTLLKLEPLKGTCLLDIPPRLGLCIVDRELGGSGVGPSESGELGRMEARLLGRVVEMIVNEWCGSWRDLHDLRPVFLKHESNARFVKTSEPDTMVLVLGISVKIGEVAEQIRFAFPYHALEPLMARLNAASETEAKSSAAVPTAKQGWNPSLSDLQIQVSAELPDLYMTARQVAGLKLGEIIPLPAQSASEARVCLAATPRFFGNLGLCDDRWAVKISGVLKD